MVKQIENGGSGAPRGQANGTTVPPTEIPGNVSQNPGTVQAEAPNAELHEDPIPPVEPAEGTNARTDQETLCRHIQLINTLDTYISELAENEEVLVQSIHKEPNNEYWKSILLKNQSQMIQYQHELMQTLLGCYPGTNNEDLLHMWNQVTVKHMQP